MSNDIYVCVNQTGRWRLKYCIPYTWPSIACCYDGRMVNQYPGSQLVCYIKYNTHLQCHHRFRGYRIFWGQRVAILSLIIPAYSSLSRYQGSSSHLQPVASFVCFGEGTAGQPLPKPLLREGETSQLFWFRLVVLSFLVLSCLVHPF